MNRKKRGTALTLCALLGSALAQPIALPHEGGRLTLNAPARRVVALEYSFVDALIALGVPPVGVGLSALGGDRGAPAYLAQRLQGSNVVSVGSRAQPSLEQMATLRPDLVLSDAFVHRNMQPQLARVAPTLALQSRRGSLDDLNGQLLVIGRAVGREAVARRILAEQNSLVARAQAFANRRAPSFVAVVAAPESMTVHTSGSFVGSFLETLGRRNAVAVRGEETQYEVSLEGLVALRPQTLVLFTAGDETPVTARLQQSPLWQSLPAVQRGRVYRFDRDEWTRGRGPLAIRRMLTQSIQSRFLQDGPPASGYTHP